MSSLGYDRRTNAFLVAANAAGVRLTSVQQFAVAELVDGLSQIGWSKFHAVYPFIGGTAATHAINLINPATFGITWNGTVTHNAIGATGNGTTGFGNTGFIPSNQGVGAGNFSCGTYFSLPITVSSGAVLGANGAGVSPIINLQLTNVGTQYVACNCANNASAQAFSNTTSAFRSASAVSTTSLKVYGNGVLLNTRTSLRAGGSPAIPLALLALNNNGVTGNYCDGTCSAAFIGNGLSDNEMLSTYSTVQRYQTVLGRNV